MLKKKTHQIDMITDHFTIHKINEGLFLEALDFRLVVRVVFFFGVRDFVVVFFLAMKGTHLSRGNKNRIEMLQNI